jgi:mono/diheme cytochrome c family protein
MRIRLILVTTLGLLIPHLASAGDLPKSNAALAERFEKKVRPLLANRCWSCHGPEKVKAGLRLDSSTAIAKGGESGPVVIAGKPETSTLIEAVRYSGDLRMPPKGKMSDADVATLVEWVRDGAYWPTEPIAQVENKVPSKSVASNVMSAPIPPEAKKFWAFQPIHEPRLPDVKAQSWIKSPIDRFILHDLEAKGLEPAPQAEKRTLIRRATFDLIGLPPKPEEVQAFLDDKNPDAFAKVIDRLLASPRYGERWGRHWLDLARYADSNGMDENMAYANAFRYRDYVINAFNQDTPYDQFIKEQLAGDLLPASSNESVNHARLTATGFLVLGPKMLAEDDPMKMEMDIIDEQVDTVGRVFMGLTLGCARCHDHKFDPIPTSDYYGLAGIFKSTKSMQNHKVVAMWNERALGTKADRDRLAAHKLEVETRNKSIRDGIATARKDLLKDQREHLADYLIAGWQLYKTPEFDRKSIMKGKDATKISGLLIREAEKFDRGNVLIDNSNYGSGIGVILNKGELPNFVEYDILVPSDGIYQIEVRYAAAASRPVMIKLDGDVIASQAAGDVTGSWGPDGQKWAVAGVYPFCKGKRVVRLDCDGPFPHFDKLAFVPRELPKGTDLATLKTSRELAAEKKLNPRLIEYWRDEFKRTKNEKNSIWKPFHDRDGTPEAWRKTLLAKPVPDSPTALAARYKALFDEAQKDKQTPSPDPFLTAFRQAIDDPAGPFRLGKKAETLFGVEVAGKLKAKRDALAEFEKNAPAVTEVMAVEDQAVTNLKIHLRGNHTTLGDEVSRRFPRVIAGEKQASLSTGQSGRLELANWLASSEHPLTARVMVNRIWQGHFGEGLVRSSDNFGKLGEQPDHPELLDWLARRFIESKWSIKAMHRLIMTSSAYQMSTRLNEKAAMVDPENRLLWRMSRRRLEAEAIRDSLVFVSGRLEPTVGGSLVTTKNHAYVNNTGAGASLPYEANRRAVYLPVIRSGLYDVFQSFDFADPSASNGKRIPTTVAPQALFMMNDGVVLQSAESLAKRLIDKGGKDFGPRVQTAYELAFGRPATVKEIERAKAYLAKFDAYWKAEGVDAKLIEQRSWQTLCQAILASSEFIYID